MGNGVTCGLFVLFPLASLVFAGTGLLTSRVAALTLASSYVFAGQDFYAKAGVNFSANKVKIKDESDMLKLNKSKVGFLVGGGLNIDSKSRAELTIDQAKYTKDGEKVKITKLMLSGEYDLVEITNGINLYGTVGAGIAKVKVSELKKNKFALAVGTGINGKVNNEISWDLGYKFTHIAKAKGHIDAVTNTKGSIPSKVKLSQHSVIASVKYKL